MEDQGIVPNWYYILRDLAKPSVHETSTPFELTGGEEVVALESHLGASPCHDAVFICTIKFYISIIALYTIGTGTTDMK